MRKYITAIIAIALVIGAYFIGGSIANKEKKIRPQSEKVKQAVVTATVKNGLVAVNIKESGRLAAKDRLEIYAEVQGVMERGPKDFKPGTAYSKGELMVNIRDDDYYANLQAQKSVLQNLITSLLPDLRLDYPEAYKKWDQYLKDFDMDKPIKDLPETTSAKEKFFITGKDIYTTYYKTKNLEIILAKYHLRAPFDGILTDALVTPGSVVRPGQKLGEFINPAVYELELAVSKLHLPELSVGKSVRVSMPEDEQKVWQGQITRINGKVNTSTQTIQVYVEVKGKDLREGMYLQAAIEANAKTNAFTVSRNLLVDDSKLYVVESNKLQTVPITILHRTKDSLIVSGLKDGMQVIIKPVPGSYVGMEVTTNNIN